MTRTARRLSLLVVTASLALLAVLPLLVGCSRKPARPNVVVVVLDSVRRDFTGCGGAESSTPNLDRLMSEATGFTNAWATAPWTPPSHASMFTGLLPSKHDCRGRSRTLPTRWPTLAERLGDAGYETAAFHSNPWLTNELTGLMRGFETQFTEAAPDMGVFGRSEQGGPETVRNISRWLDGRDKHRPFFMFVNILEAHLPYDPPADYRKARLSDLPPDDSVSTRWANEVNAGLHEGERVDWQRVRRLYAGDVAEADRLLGEILGKLRSLELYDDAVIIVTSDHGENLGDHGYTDHQFGVFETLLAVPLVVRAPGRLQPGVRQDPVMLTDLYATALSVAGVKDEQPSEHSRSLLGPPAHPDRPLIAEYAGPPDILMKRLADINPGLDAKRLSAAHSAVRIGAMRLTASSDGKVTLFDLSQDPAESRNLAEKEREKVNTMIKLIPSVRPGAASDTEIDERMAEWLRSLGYM
jgi:arylsulfatase A-like enzyme